MDIRYATADKGKLRLTVNGDDYSFLNTLSTGGWNSYSGNACLTIPLQPGPTNVIRLTGGNGGVNVDYLTIIPFPHPERIVGEKPVSAMVKSAMPQN